MNNLYSENEQYQFDTINKEAMGPGLYMLDVSKKLNQVVYPWAHLQSDFKKWEHQSIKICH